MSFAGWMRGLALGAICAATAGAALAEDKVVRVATSTTGMLYLPLYVGDVMGYFKEEGLDVQTQTMKSSAIMAAVIGGDVDIYPGTASAAMRAVEKGADVRVFGALLTQYASNMVLQGDKAKELGLTADSSFEDRVKALKGLTIGVTGAGSGTHQLALYLLRHAGLDPDKDATIVFVGGSREVLAAFGQKRIDAFILSNPTSDTAIMENGGFSMFDMVGGAVPELNGYPYIVLIAQNEWLSADPERSTAMLRAIGKAQAAIKDPAMTNDVRDKVYEAYLSQFDKALFDAAWANVSQAYPTSPAIDAKTLTMAVDYLNEVSDDKYDASLVDKTLNDEYVKKATMK